VNTFTQEELKTVGEVKANSLILGDCLQVMPYIASGSVDAIITDLPYG
jgi:DNA modification methylase